MANMVIEAKAQDINFVTRFEKDIQHLLDVLGKTSVEVVAPGTAFKVYETSGTLSATAVAEKALIPDSNIAVGNPTTIEIAYKKYRNLTSIEKIGKVGYDLAVGKTNDDMLKQVQNGIRASIFAGLATGTGTATGASFQAAIAAAAAQVAVKFEAEVATPVFFVNPADLYGYLGTHNVTLESEFGLNYLKVYEVRSLNIPGMELQTDETGIVAIHNGALYENGAVQTVVYCGLAVHPAFLDRIIKASISA